MYKEVLSAVSGIDVYPVISLLLFVLVFGVVVFRAMRLDGVQLQELARLPLEKNDRDTPTR